MRSLHQLQQKQVPLGTWNGVWSKQSTVAAVAATGPGPFQSCEGQKQSIAALPRLTCSSIVRFRTGVLLADLRLFALPNKALACFAICRGPWLPKVHWAQVVGDLPAFGPGSHGSRGSAWLQLGGRLSLSWRPKDAERSFQPLRFQLSENFEFYVAASSSGRSWASERLPAQWSRFCRRPGSNQLSFEMNTAFTATYRVRCRCCNLQHRHTARIWRLW